MPFNQRLGGLIEPTARSWGSASSAERKALYEYAGKLAVKRKREELARAIGANGRRMKPRKHPRRDGADGPVMTPHDSSSRTARLMDARATDNGVTLFWHSGISGRQRTAWGTILGYHADGKVRGAPKRDVRLSRRSITKLKAELARWWTTFRSAATRAETRAASAAEPARPGPIARATARARAAFTRRPASAPAPAPAPPPAPAPAATRARNRPLTAEQRALVARYPNLKPYLLNPRDGFGPGRTPRPPRPTPPPAPAPPPAPVPVPRPHRARPTPPLPAPPVRPAPVPVPPPIVQHATPPGPREAIPPKPVPTPKATSTARTFGISKAKVEDSGRASIAEAETAATHIFGRPIKAHDLATMAGAPDNAVVTFEAADKDYISIHVEGPDYRADRTIHAKSRYEPHLRIHNDQLVIDPTARGKGLGPEILGRQVEHSVKMGVELIDTQAARMSFTYTDGYAVWPKLGYDGPLPSTGGFNPMPNLPPTLAGSKRVSDLMATKEGRDWWIKHGVTVDLEFDLKAGSLSRDTLHKYLNRTPEELAAARAETAARKAGNP